MLGRPPSNVKLLSILSVSTVKWHIEDDKLSVWLEVKRLIKYRETQWTRLSKVYPNTEPLPDCRNEESLALVVEHLSHVWGSSRWVMIRITKMDINVKVSPRCFLYQPYLNSVGISNVQPGEGLWILGDLLWNSQICNCILCESHSCAVVFKGILHPKITLMSFQTRKIFVHLWNTNEDIFDEIWELSDPHRQQRK